MLQHERSMNKWHLLHSAKRLLNSYLWCCGALCQEVPEEARHVTLDAGVRMLRVGMASGGVMVRYRGAEAWKTPTLPYWQSFWQIDAHAQL